MTMPIPSQYLTNETGQKVGVVFSWETYRRLFADPDFLFGLGQPELQAIANGMLAPTHQNNLSNLLQLQKSEQIDEDQLDELDTLLEEIDRLNMLKTRAMYTLKQLAA